MPPMPCRCMCAGATTPMIRPPTGIHGTCSVEYYGRAVDYMMAGCRDRTCSCSQTIGNGRAEIFTSMCRPPLCMPIRPTAAFIDMQLMSRCRHHILANSSFSWWGAWLNPSQDKVVIAPKCWFNDRGADTRDLIPESWIRL